MSNTALKQILQQHKDKLIKTCAIVLLTIMIATHFSACDNFEILPGPDTTEQQTQQHNNSTESYVTDIDYSETESATSAYENMFEGDVWQAMLNRPETYLDKLEIITSKDLIGYLPMPIQFLSEEGIMHQTSSGELYIGGKRLSELDYTPLSIKSGTDPNTKENDVYLIVNYLSERVNDNNMKDAWVANWKLKYTLSDEDYQTFLALDGDFRARLFVQEMDKIYEPEVVSKAVTTFDLTRLACPIEINAIPGPNYNYFSTFFPDMYISNVDYDNQVVTICALKDGDYYYYDVDINNERLLQKLSSSSGYSPEEILKNYVYMESTPTIAGECLTKFNIGRYQNKRTLEESKKLLAEATKMHDLDFYYSGSVTSKYKVNHSK